MNKSHTGRSPTPPDPARANHERIKFQLRLKGYSLAEVSRLLNVSRPTLTLISQGHQRSQRVERGLAELLEEELCVAFPDRYDPKRPAATNLRASTTTTTD